MGYTAEIIRYASIGLAALLFMGLGKLVDSPTVQSVGLVAGLVSLVGFLVISGHALWRRLRAPTKR